LVQQFLSPHPRERSVLLRPLPQIGEVNLRGLGRSREIAVDQEAEVAFEMQPLPLKEARRSEDEESRPAGRRVPRIAGLVHVEEVHGAKKGRSRKEKGQLGSRLPRTRAVSRQLSQLTCSLYPGDANGSRHPAAFFGSCT